MESEDRCRDDWTDIVTPEMLTRRVSLDAYFAEKTAWVGKGYISRETVDQDRAKLEARARPYDEWWEWILGTEYLMQMGGLALVRCGDVVWAREDWIS